MTPSLIITNHHVVAAREPHEHAPTDSEFEAQAIGTKAWFDYYVEGGTRCEHACSSLITYNKTLNYAILRLKSVSGSDSRRPLTISQASPALCMGSRLNIVQCPGGGPLKYAIRSNFFVGNGDTPSHLRYLTDTSPGSSGSPILDDSWSVIGLHHAYREVPANMYKGDVVKYHNQGIRIHAILKALPSAVREEIEAAQGWPYAE